LNVGLVGCLEHGVEGCFVCGDLTLEVGDGLTNLSEDNTAKGHIIDGVVLIVNDGQQILGLCGEREAFVDHH